MTIETCMVEAYRARAALLRVEAISQTGDRARAMRKLAKCLDELAHALVAPPESPAETLLVSIYPTVDEILEQLSAGDLQSVRSGLRGIQDAIAETLPDGRPND